MGPDIASVLELVTFVFVGTIVISIIFTVVLLIWTFARISERSSTRDLVKELKGPDNTQNNQKDTSPPTEDDIQQMIMQAIANILRDSGANISPGVSPIDAPPPQPSLEQSITSQVREQFGIALQPAIDQTETSTASPAPDSRSNALLRTGHVHLKHGDVDSAINDYTAALRLSPTFADAFKMADDWMVKWNNPDADRQKVPYELLLVNVSTIGIHFLTGILLSVCLLYTSPSPRD